ncbi:hypothetical protein Hanom_Chr08g00731741 [Helianthus anomalus]
MSCFYRKKIEIVVQVVRNYWNFADCHCHTPKYQSWRDWTGIFIAQRKCLS